MLFELVYKQVLEPKTSVTRKISCADLIKDLDVRSSSWIFPGVLSIESQRWRERAIYNLTGLNMLALKLVAYDHKPKNAGHQKLEEV